MVGLLHVEASRFGFGELGMAVAALWRGRGVGSALMEAAIQWAREHGLHKSRRAETPTGAAASSVNPRRSCSPEPLNGVQLALVAWLPRGRSSAPAARSYGT